jgi:hypothetical protein
MYNMVRRHAVAVLLSLALLMNGCTFPWSSKRPIPPPTALAPTPNPAPSATPTLGKAVWIDASASPFPHLSFRLMNSAERHHLYW